MIKRVRTISIFALLLVIACVEPYNPPSSKGEINLLVVDGFLNGTSASATVKLTKAVPLSVSIAYPPETGATVTIESENGSSYALPEIDKGIYQVNSLVLDASSDYRLRMQLKSGASYTSDYVRMRQSPILDSVSWRPEATGTRFYVSSHDPDNQTTYYRYLFTQTWEYRTVYYSFWKKVNGLPVFRNPEDQVFTCWNSTLSTDVLTISTRQLSEDVVNMFPINFIKKGSRMLSREYSINVQQRAISQQEYEYWELIRKTTESLGGLFDPLPSQVIGNVRNDSDNTEQVLGYFSGGYVNEKRIFISFLDLPGYLQRVDGYDFECLTYFVPISHPELVGSDTFVEQIGQPPIGYSAAIGNCADCRSLGGDNVKPAFWPN